MNDKAKEMEAIFLKRVSVCQDNVHHAKKNYEQAKMAYKQAQADLVLWQNSVKENV